MESSPGGSGPQLCFVCTAFSGATLENQWQRAQEWGGGAREWIACRGLCSRPLWQGARSGQGQAKQAGCAGFPQGFGPCAGSSLMCALG